METIYSNGLRIAVEGCGHGTLDAIYASVNEACRVNNFQIDLLIICGDFQAVRNAADLNTMSVPPKYRTMADFWQYYNGTKKAPYLTIFIGGNHEASSHLWELFYGGWVCPNIYYLGCAGVVNVGGLRIAGISGIYNANDYNKDMFERLPYTPSTTRSMYHVRAYQVFKLFQLSGDIDIMISHDWPNGIEQYGNVQKLLRVKKYFQKEVETNTLGSPPLLTLLTKLRPKYWFSAHMHVKFAALFRHTATSSTQSTSTSGGGPPKNPDELDLDMSDNEVDTSDLETVPVKNDAEIDLDLDDDDDQIETKPVQTSDVKPDASSKSIKVDDPEDSAAGVLQYPSTAQNTETRFLALDKCLPGRDFLQISEIPARNPHGIDSLARAKLYYDPEWLAITRVLNKLMPTSPRGNHRRQLEDLGKNESELRQQIRDELEWVQQNLVGTDKMEITESFQTTAPPQYDNKMDIREQPPAYNNPQTQAFCDLVQIQNKVATTYRGIIEKVDNGN